MVKYTIIPCNQGIKIEVSMLFCQLPKQSVDYYDDLLLGKMYATLPSFPLPRPLWLC